MKALLASAVLSLCMAASVPAADPKPEAAKPASSATKPAEPAGQEPFEVTNGVKIYKSVDPKGSVYRNFRFTLTPKNTLLPSDPNLMVQLGVKRIPDNNRELICDENSVNFKYGQFEVFIPVKDFPLVNHKTGYVTLRMPQTLFNNKYSTDSADPNRFDHIAAKQALYLRIKEMVTLGKGEVEVVLEFPAPDNAAIDRLALFRHDSGQYVDYTGQLKAEGKSGPTSEESEKK